MIYGNYIEDGEIIINKNDINNKKLANAISKHRKSISRKLKALENNEMIEFVENQEGIFYKIKDLYNEFMDQQG